VRRVAVAPLVLPRHAILHSQHSQDTGAAPSKLKPKTVSREPKTAVLIRFDTVKKTVKR